MRGAVSQVEARGWDQITREYIAAKKKKQSQRYASYLRVSTSMQIIPRLCLGFPEDSVVFCELYGSPAQIQARSHLNVTRTNKLPLASFFHALSTTPISLHTPMPYSD